MAIIKKSSKSLRFFVLETIEVEFVTDLNIFKADILQFMK